MVNSEFGMRMEGGVPVFHPTYDEFRDFKSFVAQIEPMGMQTGIVKIVPPKEWLDALPKLNEEDTASIKIKQPIVQNVMGSQGIFRFQNVEKGRTFSINAWRKVCHDVSNLPPAKRGESRKNEQENLPEDITEYDGTEFTDERCDELERTYWRSIGFSTPMYGADMPGSLFSDRVKEWNVAHLDSVLSNLDIKIPGVNTAYLYCGMWKASFPWHLEDMDLHSINYIHFGAPKQWYSISQSDRPRFFRVMKSIFAREFRGCPEFLRHKTFMVSPAVLEQHGVKVNKVVHRQREFIITWAYGYHAGYNYGFNVAESVNFATPNWLYIGVKSEKCRCISDSVGIDVKRLIRQINGEPPSPPLSPEEPEREIEEPVKLAKKRPQKRVLESKESEPKKAKILKQGNCVLCPHKWDDRYLRNEAGTASVHEICCKLIPETKVAAGLVEGLESVPPERFKLKCLECRVPMGACLQCASAKCVRAYHATCAQAAGMSIRDGMTFCRLHRDDNALIEPPLDTGYASGLLVGDAVQCHTPRRQPFAGIVEENILSEGMLVLRALPDRTIKVEVTYDQVIPFRFDVDSVGDQVPQVKEKGRPLSILDVEVKAEPAPITERADLYANKNISGEVVSPFLFMGVPLPDCLKRSYAL